MRGRAWWNKAHYGNENIGSYNNLYRKAACIREGQCSITVIRDNNSVLKYEEEQQECWTFHCTCVEIDSSFILQEAGCWQPTQKVCAIPQENPTGHLCSTTTSWQHWSKNSLTDLGKVWGKQVSLCLTYSFQHSPGTKSDITRSLIIQMLNDYIGKMIMAGNLNVCKIMVNHCLTFGNSWGICKKKFNIKD